MVCKERKYRENDEVVKRREEGYVLRRMPDTRKQTERETENQVEKLV